MFGVKRNLTIVLYVFTNIEIKLKILVKQNIVELFFISVRKGQYALHSLKINTNSTI